MMGEIMTIGSKAIIASRKEHSAYNLEICKVIDANTKGNLFQVEVGEKEPKTYLWMEKNELIPILYENKEDIEKYGKLEDVYNLFSEYKAYYDFICKVANEECNRAEKLTGENKELKYEIAENQKCLHNLNAKMKELRTRCDESVMNDFDNNQYGRLFIIGAEDLKSEEIESPREPVKVAEMLICKTEKCKNLFYGEQECSFYSKSELRQIAEHLLVYCNAEEQKGEIV